MKFSPQLLNRGLSLSMGVQIQGTYNTDHRFAAVFTWTRGYEFFLCGFRNREFFPYRKLHCFSWDLLLRDSSVRVEIVSCSLFSVAVCS